MSSSMPAMRGVLLALGACLLASPALVAQGPDTLPTVTLPADLDRVLRSYERAWRSRDPAGLAALFTEDGFVLSGGQPPVRGRAAIRARYEGQGGPLYLRAIAFATGDTVGYIIGTYGTSADSINMGKYTLTLRRRPDGPWLIASDMDNPNRPPRPAPRPQQAPPGGTTTPPPE
jgi:ketosteroid isomerase-like protein